MQSVEDLAPREQPVEPASTLAVAALVTGAVGVALGATLIWFFLAMPLGVTAIVCALIERRRTRRSRGQAAGGIVTAGLVLGMVSLALALGGLAVIPRIENAAEQLISEEQADVNADIQSVERSFSKNVDDLDDTLSKNVEESTSSLASDFRDLETSSQRELRETENRLQATVDSIERSTGADLTELESQMRADLEEFEQSMREDVRIADARSQALSDALAGLERRLDRLEAEARRSAEAAEVAGG